MIDATRRIVAHCLTIDGHAAAAYRSIAERTGEADLARFWADMAAEEDEHQAYWQALLDQGGDGALPPIFEDPERVEREMAGLAEKAAELAAAAAGPQSPRDDFMTAFRFEFFMLHPAFERLFHALRASQGRLSPEDGYLDHLGRFIDMLAERGDMTPEFELISESLQRLWRDNMKLTRQALRDDLTDLLNRRGFTEVVEQLLRVADRNRRPVGLLMIDIDDFKRVNDTHGHARGDAVLREVARRLAGSVRASDLVGRFGGEEFVVFLFGIDPAAATEVVEKIRSAVADRPVDDLSVTVSLGVSDCAVPSADATLDDLLRQADRRLYVAKREGKNRAVARG